MKSNRIFSIALLVSCCIQFSFVTVAQEPNFTEIMPELFSVAGSLSNAWADIDGDGDSDLAVSIKGGEIRLYLNDEGTFKSVGETLGLPTSGDEIRGLSWGDYDKDGDLDLLAGSNVFPTPSRTYIYRNDRGEGFAEVANQIGLTIPARWSRQSNWVDYDNDGDLDLYAANRTGSNRLFNNRNGNFQSVASNQAPNDPRRSVGACWLDIDTDGDLDLFLANQSGDSDALWRNDPETFTDIASQLGIDQTMRTLKDGGVGCAFGDYDNDGDFDLYVGAYGKNLLYNNKGNGDFVEVADDLGVTDPVETVGAAWGDYNNDGWLDLMVVGYRNPGQIPENKLYENDRGTFKNVLTKGGILDVGDHGVEWVDYDNDGDLDLSVTDGYGPTGGHFLFRNELEHRGDNQSIAILIVDSDGDYTRAGAEIRLYDSLNNILGSRQVSVGGGYNTQSATPVVFGVASNNFVNAEIRFMGSGGGHIQRVENIDIRSLKNKVLIIKESAIE
ncbi:VCBS repeat-containing protein [Gammaproteobacteria bacterium]|nr:VCBS repeat-containing protein [Gammaproteobacteria bacterium]